jgi:ribonuclease D
MELDPPRYIDTQAALGAWVDHVARATVIAVDTESDSLHHYHEKVCLIQMTALGEDALIDPLALESLDPLRDIFADPGRQKVFHDACYDLMSLARDFHFRFAGLFDTMLASRFLGQREFGLAAVLRQRFDFFADKRLQRSDWAVRPLTPQQISYARYDTHFLPELAAVLAGELQACGRYDWACEEFERLPDIADRATPRPLVTDPNGFWRMRGVRSLAPLVKGRVRALWLMRERIAEQLDRPRFKVLSDAVILELALDPPTSLAELPRPGLRRAGIERFGADILTAVREARPVSGGPPAGAPRRRRRSGRFLDADTRERFDALRAMRRDKAEQLGLEPEVALGNAVLEDLARDPPATLAEVAARPELRGWRSDVFAEAIVDCLRRSAASCSVKEG